ncbi:MAG: type II secretion system F family protein [Syntrophomonas sp.]
MSLIFVAVGLVFAAVLCLTIFIVNVVVGDKLVLKDRLQQMEIKMTRRNKLGFNEELQEDFSVRILKPISGKLSSVIQRYTPVKQMSFIEQRLDYAGRPFDWTANDYLSVQYLTTMGAAIIAYLVAWLMDAGTLNGIIALLAGAIGGYLLFELIITNKISIRQKDIARELPDALDMLTISVEAGLGFDAAMQKVSQKAKGPIAEEFSKTLHEMRIGKTRREALRDLSKRTEVLDMSRFVESLVQADQLGVSLGNVLRNQSDQMRVLRRQRVQEQAMKAPIKMLFPIMIFIMPTIFIIILGPAIINLSKAL